MGLDDWKKLPRSDLKSSELGSDGISKRIAYALDNGLSLEILYASADDLTRRTVWPKYLQRVSTGHSAASSYLRAYCEMRGEDRTFRLDRIREARVPDGPVELRATVKASEQGPRKVSATRSAPMPQRPATVTTNRTPGAEAGQRTGSQPKAAASGGCLVAVAAMSVTIAGLVIGVVL